MSNNLKVKRSAYLNAIAADNSIPIQSEAVELWLKDLDNPFRWTLRPIFQFLFACLLHLTWFLKRLPLPQFSAHTLLQKTICWFSKNFVSYEANMLILRHYATESNILNFLIANSRKEDVADVGLYPKTIEEMNQHSFVDHDQELFRVFENLGNFSDKIDQPRKDAINWNAWSPIVMEDFKVEKKITQVFDFESAHALFMCLFCLLLKRDEYRDAINGFNLDQSIAIRVGKIVNDNGLAEFAYNKYPLYLVGPWNLSQRFLMHGFFTEYLYAYLEDERRQNGTD